MLQGWKEKLKGGTRLKASAKLFEGKICFGHSVSATWTQLLPRRGPSIRHLQQGDIMTISIQSLLHCPAAAGYRRSTPAINPVFTGIERAEKFGYPLLVEL